MTHATLHDRFNSAPARRRQAGFTLIEVLVVLIVTVIGLLGLLTLHTATLKGNRDSSRAAEATTIAQRAVEELRSIPVTGGIDNITSRYGTLPIQNVQLDTVFGRANIMYKPTLWVAPLASGELVRMRVVVEWSDSGDDPSVVDEMEKHAVALELIRTTQEAL